MYFMFFMDFVSDANHNNPNILYFASKVLLVSGDSGWVPGNSHVTVEVVKD